MKDNKEQGKKSKVQSVDVVKDSVDVVNDPTNVDKELQSFEKDTRMGRPLVEVDIDNLNSLCELGCTLKEIASFFRCGERTVERRIKSQFDMTFGEYYALKEGRGTISLRRIVMQLARGEREVLIKGEGKDKVIHKPTKPNTPILLQLMKTRLGLSEKISMEHSGPSGSSIKFRNKSDEEIKGELGNLLKAIETLEKNKNAEKPTD